MGGYGRRFRKCRREAGLKQVEAARAVGVGQATISAYENDVNEPTADVIFRMARVYGVPSDYLLGLTDERGES